MKRDKKKRRTGLGTIALMVMVICCIVSFKRGSLDAKSAKYEKQIAELEQQIEVENDRTKEIEEREAYVKTKKYVEEVAREKLGLVYKDEIIFQSED